MKFRLRTPRIEFIYVMFSWRLGFVAKIGRTNDIVRRLAEIRNSLKTEYGAASLIPVMCVPVFNPVSVEVALHRFAGKWYKRAKHIRGDGATEWFYSVNLITATLIYIVTGNGMLSLFILLIPAPIDFSVLALGIAAAQWGALFFIASLIF